MLAALFAAALWIHLATYFRAPVSTTHSIVGAVLGAGAAAAGFSAVNWPVVARITASWIISPIMGGVIAAILLAFIKFAVLYRSDRLSAARLWVPALTALTGSTFSTYLLMKGLAHVWSPSFLLLLTIGTVIFLIVFAISKYGVARAAAGLANTRKDVAKLFTLPLIFAAAVLSFAHGANDVANAVGPLSAIAGQIGKGGVDVSVAVPGWVLTVGGFGIAIGLGLFGPRLIRMVGEQITKLNPIRAFCVALAAGITVIIASALGLPVSSTHIAVGGVFGVGFLREFISNRRMRPDIAYPGQNGSASAAQPENGIEAQRVREAKQLNRRLVRRQHLLTILAAWVVTVPCAAVLSAALYLGIRLIVG
jgi:PiT family inorganic phosphate transporter